MWRRFFARICFACALCAWSAASPAASQQRIALLIGNQNYADGVGRLANPHRDIERLSSALMEVGFEILPLVKEARRGDILQAVYTFADRLKQAGPDAVGFFYYSGHGIAETEFGPNYLIPIDLPRVNRAALRIEGVKLSEITGILDREASNAAHFVVFDACRNELRGTRGAKGFAAVAEKDGMVIAFASAPGMTASDGAGNDGGPYARALAKEIVRRGLDHYSVLFNVREALVNDPETSGQFPWWRDGLRRRIHFATGGGGPGVPLSDAAQDHDSYSVSNCTPKQQAEAKEFWQKIQGLRPDPYLYEALIAKYPGCIHAAIAEAQLKRLREQDVAVGLTEPQTPGPIDAQCDGVSVSLGTGGTECVVRGSGKSFRDCPDCPEMVVAPSGRFDMGSSTQEIAELTKEYGDYFKDEGPRHEVTISEPFAVGGSSR